jgi:hypothetical protein
MIPGVYLFRMASGLLEIAGGSQTSVELIGATAADGLAAAGIVLTMVLGLVVTKALVDDFIERWARWAHGQ